MLREGEIDISLTAAESLRCMSLEAVKQACSLCAKNFVITPLAVQECASINALIELVLFSVGGES